MEKENLNNKIGSSFLWKILENFLAQGIQFVISIILARLLSPKEYGIIALVMVFISIANVLIQNGFSMALIQKKEIDSKSFNSVFSLNLILSIFMYIILFLLSPFIAKFYKLEEIKTIFRLLGIIIFPASIISVQNSYIVRNLKFRLLFIATLISAIMSGFVSIYLAFNNYGVYALVYQQIVYYFSLNLILFFSLKLNLKFNLDFLVLKSLFSFGSKILLASLIDNIFNNIHSLVIGKIYNEDSLGNYSRGEQFPKLIVANITGAMQAIIFPMMSKVQDKKEKVREILKKSLSLSSYIIFPMMFGLMSISDTLILVLLGNKWQSSIIFLRLLCICYLLWPIHVANLQAINALGHSGEFLKLEIIKKSMSLIFLFIGIYFNSIIFVLLKLVAEFISVFINIYPNNKLLGYGFKMQIKDITDSLFISIIMAIFIYIFNLYIPFSVLKLVFLILFGIIIYIILSILSKNKNYLFLLKQIKLWRTHE